MKTILLAIPICCIIILTAIPAYSQVNWKVEELVEEGRFDAIADLGDGVVIVASRRPNPGIIFRSINYGITWEKLGTITRQEDAQGENEVLCLMGGPGDLAYMLTSSAQFWRSSDKGVTWEKTAQLGIKPEKWPYSYSINVTPQGTVLATNGSSIYRSTDDGLNFEKIGPISNENIYRLNQVGDGVIVNGWAGTVYKSVDDGQTWQYWAKMDSTPLYATEYMGRTVILQASESGSIYKTEQNYPEKTKEVAKFKDAADDFVYLGFQSAIYSTYTGDRNNYISYDEGENWEDIGPIPTGAEGDWLDHVIRLNRPDSVIAIGGTNKGYIARAAFSNEDLYNRSNPDRDQELIDKESLEEATVGMLTDYFDLNEPEDILFDGDYAYVPNRVGHNLAVIDISNPKEPKIVESFRDEELQEAMGVAQNGRYLYVTSMVNQKCLVIDAKDPENLKKVYSFSVGGVNKFQRRLRKVVYDDGYLYFSHDGEGALYIADARNPAKPEIISSLQMGNGAFAIKIKGDIAYVGGCVGSNALKVIDISDKRNPELIQSIEDSLKYNCICDFEITGDVLHAISYGSNAYIQFDISNPKQIKEIAYFQSEKLKGPNRFVLMNGKIYMINSINDSVAELNIEGEISISRINSSRIFQKAYGLNHKDGLLYITSRDAMNFVILDPVKLSEIK